MERSPQRGGMLPKHAQVQKVGVVLKGVAAGHILLQQRKIWLEEVGQEAPQDYIAIQYHMNVIDSDGQMSEQVGPQSLVLRQMLFHPGKKLFQGNAQVVTDPPGGAIGLQAAAFSTVAEQPPGSTQIWPNSPLRRPSPP